MPLHAHRTPLLAAPALAAALLALSGCNGFFVYPGSSSTTSSSSTDYAYIANSSAGATSIAGYALSSGTLVAATSSPYSLQYVPSALAVTPANTYLYAAEDTAISGASAIFGYSIGTGGALTVLDSGVALVAETSSAIDISPDGKWLFSLNTDGLTLEQYSIASTTGLLTFFANYSITGATGGTVTPSSVKVAPSGDFIVCALGTGGVETFTFNTSTGAATPSSIISPGSTSIGIYAVAVDTNNYLYAAGTAGLQVFSTTTAGAPTLLNTYSTGNGPRSIVITSNGSYVYVANQTDGTISGYSIGTNAALTAISGSPFTGPSTVTSLGRDNSGSRILALGYNATSGLQLFSIGSTGALTLTNTAASGTTTIDPSPLALTH
jgi:6-phosphogluconolactonase (cycloisomerase 2 family)